MKLEYIDLSSSSSYLTQLRLSFSVELSWERSTQLNRVKSDSRFNSVNLTSWLEFDCRSTFYQILYQIFYQSDQTFYQTLYQTLYHVFYHIFIIFPTMFLIIFSTIFSTTLSTIFSIIFPSYFSLYSLSYFISIFLSNSLSNWLQNWLQKKIWKKEKKCTIFSNKNQVQATQLDFELSLNWEELT